MIVRSKPLLYKAAEMGRYGKVFRFSHGCIADALFIFLDGEPEPDSEEMLESRFGGRQWVCLTPAWEARILTKYPEIRSYTRYMMMPASFFKFQSDEPLPEGCQVKQMDREAFDLHPFAQCRNYPSYEAFEAEGSGAAAWLDGKIAASASSFISLCGEVEMDLCTDEAYQGKGLASACTERMLMDCMEKGYTVHWDAQNETSRHLAKKFGFVEETPYTAYFVPWVIRTERLFLRKMTDDDYDALYAVLGDREIMQHYPYDFDEARVRSWISRNRERYKKDGFGLYAVCLRSTGEMIGDCGLTLQQIDGETLPEIGYHIRRDCQHKGYAREAAAAVMDWAFTTQSVDSLYSYCKYTNIPSCKTAESIGMHFLKEYEDEANKITHVSCITRVEWAAKRGSQAFHSAKG